MIVDLTRCCSPHFTLLVDFSPFGLHSYHDSTVLLLAICLLLYIVTIYLVCGMPFIPVL